MAEEVDLSVGNILKLNTKAQLQQDDLYTFLKREFPDISAEDRLKYLSAVLNDFFEAYRFDNADEFSADGYVIKRFYPKGLEHVNDE
ncbi:MAG: hypothetical protein L3J47_06255 [Sulfurovum sp.]|nr:hypothetical protein [Sulfurovum sp.]